MRDKETNTEPNLEGDSRARERTMREGGKDWGGSRQTTSGRCGHVDRSVASWPKKDRKREKIKQNGETKRKMKCANGKAGTETAELVELHIPNLI